MNNQTLNSLPIGVFDSGVGGLTVLKALQKQLPGESFIYLGDTARLPYGTKSQETVIRYAQQTAQILIDRGIKCLVIACNTATTLALPALQATIKDIPVIGVLEPGAKAACSATKNGRIVVIATEATVKAQGYQNAIAQLQPELVVTAKGCSLFVALAEEGWVEGPIAEAVAARYLAPLFSVNHGMRPDCLVLGCTHFPILINAIRAVVGSEINIVDSAQSTAETVARELKQLGLLNPNLHPILPTRFLVTDSPSRFATVAKYFLGTELPISDIALVDLIASMPSLSSSTDQPNYKESEL